MDCASRALFALFKHGAKRMTVADIYIMHYGLIEKYYVLWTKQEEEI